jgi:multidrug efflux pump subunit AcrB
VVYVTADMAGAMEAQCMPFGMTEKLDKIDIPKGYELNELYMDQPTDESDYTVKWDGEWQITLDVFRDLGIAFLVAIVIIYMLIVGWFQNFKK